MCFEPKQSQAARMSFFHLHHPNDPYPEQTQARLKCSSRTCMMVRLRSKQPFGSGQISTTSFDRMTLSQGLFASDHRLTITPNPVMPPAVQGSAASATGTRSTFLYALCSLRSWRPSLNTALCRRLRSSIPNSQPQSLYTILLCHLL
jgi:hypothetical protein